MDVVVRTVATTGTILARVVSATTAVIIFRAGDRNAATATSHAGDSGERQDIIVEDLINLRQRR